MRQLLITLEEQGQWLPLYSRCLRRVHYALMEKTKLAYVAASRLLLGSGLERVERCSKGTPM